MCPSPTHRMCIYCRPSRPPTPVTLPALLECISYFCSCRRRCIQTALHICWLVSNVVQFVSTTRQVRTEWHVGHLGCRRWKHSLDLLLIEAVSSHRSVYTLTLVS